MTNRSVFYRVIVEYWGVDDFIVYHFAAESEAKEHIRLTMLNHLPGDPWDERPDRSINMGPGQKISIWKPKGFKRPRQEVRQRLVEVRAIKSICLGKVDYDG